MIKTKVLTRKEREKLRHITGEKNKDTDPVVSTQKHKNNLDFGFPVDYFYGSCHGKGPSEGAGAVVKSVVEELFLWNKFAINNARDLYDFSKKIEIDSDDHIHYKRSLFLVENVQRDRPNRIIAKTLVGTRKLQCVRTVLPMTIETRNVTCFVRVVLLLMENVETQIMWRNGKNNILMVGIKDKVEEDEDKDKVEEDEDKVEDEDKDRVEVDKVLEDKEKVERGRGQGGKGRGRGIRQGGRGKCLSAGEVLELRDAESNQSHYEESIGIENEESISNEERDCYLGMKNNTYVDEWVEQTLTNDLEKLNQKSKSKKQKVRYRITPAVARRILREIHLILLNLEHMVMQELIFALSSILKCRIFAIYPQKKTVVEIILTKFAKDDRI
ncbi:unnamed protein product [Mytilus edulis]|uniref:Uncharacterized protein n=1 Tax=Mytilus edulis TaxID=6550 RepID=A0A8S3Q2D4_MYTED|nr:unnamed protein product [Mytilus edulis]